MPVMHATDAGRHRDARRTPSTQPPPPPERVTVIDRPRASDRAVAAERRIVGAVHVLDDLVRIPGTGTRFGIDPLIGLVPFVGDFASALFSAWIVLEAARFRLPKIVILRMILNAIVDFGIGLIPFVGDLVDFGFKSNRRNLDLFHRHAVDLDADTTGSQALVIGVVAVLVGVAWLVAVLLGNLLSTVVG
jgi:hypothetical protein